MVVVFLFIVENTAHVYFSPPSFFFHQFSTSLQISRLEDQLASKTTALQQLVMVEKSLIRTINSYSVQNTIYLNMYCRLALLLSYKTCNSSKHTRCLCSDVVPKLTNKLPREKINTRCSNYMYMLFKLNELLTLTKH